MIDYFQRHGGELVRLEVSKAGKAGTGGVFVWRAARADRAVAGEEAMIVAGVGCRRGTSADEIERVAAPGARHASSCRPSACRRSPRESEKATEPAFPEAARRLSVELVACTVTDLDRVAGRGPHPVQVRAGEPRACRRSPRPQPSSSPAATPACWARASPPSARPAPSPPEKADDACHFIAAPVRARPT